MFYIIHIPSDSPVLIRKIADSTWATKYIYFPCDTVIAEYLITTNYKPAIFYSMSSAKRFLSRVDKKRTKEFMIIPHT